MVFPFVFSLVVAAQTPCRIAVMDLDNQGLPADEAHVPKVLTEALAAAVAEASGCDVLMRQDIASMVDFEAERAACGGSTSDSCLSEIGNALGVERMVAGSVARVGTSTTVTARLLNLKLGKVEARAEETTGDDTTLRSVAQTVGGKLLGKTAAPAAEAGGANPVLLGVGGVVGAVGVVAAVVGGVWAFSADGVLANAKAARSEKDAARADGVIALGVGVVGVSLIVVGAGVAALGVVLE